MFKWFNLLFYFCHVCYVGSNIIMILMFESLGLNTGIGFYMNLNSYYLISLTVFYFLFIFFSACFLVIPRKNVQNYNKSGGGGTGC